MRRSQSNIKTPLVFRLGVALLCAMLVTSHLMGGLYAEYTTSATGSDSARVAKFSFGDGDWINNSQSTTLNISAMKPGDMVELEVEVENTGEVTIRYQADLTNLTGNLPLKVAIRESDQNLDTNQNSISLLPGATKELVVVVFWPQTSNSVDFMGKMDLIRITVTVEQVD